jgi:hypothetical protein
MVHICNLNLLNKTTIGNKVRWFLTKLVKFWIFKMDKLHEHGCIIHHIRNYAQNSNTTCLRHLQIINKVLLKATIVGVI